jgi:hypothetical protein
MSAVNLKWSLRRSGSVLQPCKTFMVCRKGRETIKYLQGFSLRDKFLVADRALVIMLNFACMSDISIFLSNQL